LHPIAAHYRPTIVGSLVDANVKVNRAKELETNLKRREIPPKEDTEFWIKVAGQERIREVVLNGISPLFKITSHDRAELTVRTPRNYSTPCFDSICKRIIYCWIYKIILVQFSKVSKMVKG